MFHIHKRYGVEEKGRWRFYYMCNISLINLITPTFNRNESILSVSLVFQI